MLFRCLGILLRRVRVATSLSLGLMFIAGGLVAAATYPKWSGPLYGIADWNGTQFSTAYPFPVTLGGAALPAGSAIVGKVGIDQTTPGTTNGVVVNPQFVQSTSSSTSAQLASNATFSGSGTPDQFVNQVAVSLNWSSDQPGTLTFTQCADASCAHIISVTTVPFGASSGCSPAYCANWAGITNGNAGYTTFKNTGGSTTTTLLGTTYYGTIQPTLQDGSLPVTSNDGGTKTTAAAMPAGGVGVTGWLSAIWYELSQALTVSGSVSVSALPALPAGTNNIGGVAFGPVTTAASSQLTLTSVTTAYTALWTIANSATAASATIPYFTVSVASSTVAVPVLRLVSDDTLSTAWAGQTVQIDLWNTAPTFATSHGDRATFSLATGAQTHEAAWTCVFGAIQGDGSISAECSPNQGSVPFVTSDSSAHIYWTAIATSGTGTVTASKHLTVVAKVIN